MIHATSSKQITMQAAQIQLKKNLYYFKLHCPQLFERFAHYTPVSSLYTLDQNAQPNIEHNNTYLLGGTQALNQDITDFFTSPLRRKSSLGTSELRTTYCLQDFHTERLRQIYHAHNTQKNNTETIQTIPLIVFLGMGLGTQIQKIIDQAHIQHAIVYEPNNDIFYASMHEIDYEALLHYFSKNGRSLTLQIGITPEQAILELTHKIRFEIGYSAIETYVFKQNLNQTTYTYFQLFSEMIKNSFHGLGYTEDEIIGYIHTIEKLKLGSKYLNKGQAITTLPAIIIGAGPSLDHSIQTLQRIQHHAILLSCSSSLEVLYQHGIQPDFHVEMERTRPVPEKIAMFKDKQYLKKIHLLSVNTLHPNMMGYFKSERFVFKENDVSTDIIRTLQMQHMNAVPHIETTPHIDVVPHTHPTSGNAAATIAIHLGFKNLYLFGLDFGMHSEDKHHSQDSLYYNQEWEFYADKIAGEMEVRGNFVPHIMTTQLLNAGRVSLEQVLSDNPDVTCFNTSDGVYIHGTQPLLHFNAANQLTQTPLADHQLHKQNCITHILNNHTTEFNTTQLFNVMEQQWNKAIANLKVTVQHFLNHLDHNITTHAAFLSCLDQQNKEARLAFQTIPQMGILLCGSFIQLQNITAALVLNLNEGQDINAALTHMKIIWQEYFYEMIHFCQHKISTDAKDFNLTNYVNKYTQPGQESHLSA